MAIPSNVLFSALVEDLSCHLDIDQEIAARLGGEVPHYPDESREQFASVHLLNNVLKKFITLKEDTADSKALDKFILFNEKCRSWRWVKSEWSLSDWILISTFKDVCYEVFSDSRLSFSDLTYLSNKGDLGPGANVKARGSDIYTKLYDSPLTASKDSIFELYQRYVASNDRHKNAEFIRTLSFGHGCRVETSRLSFVPKSNVISRTICTEPTLNMWFQRAYSSLIESVLRSRFGIDIRYQQEYNRELARIGSRDDTFCTIDLASASDSISLKFLEDVLPKEALSILKFFRCDKTLLPQGNKELELHMVSSMGNGYTFSLQTLIFCCMVEAVYRVHGLALHKPDHRGKPMILGNYGVFGDDILVEKETFRSMCRILSLCGFEVNRAKSFAEGPFRESCGRDFHTGANVRPVFVKDLSHESSRFAIVNLFRYWSARLMIPLKRTIGLLLSSVRKILIPRDRPIESGIHVPFALINPRQDENGSFLFKRLQPIPLSVLVLDGRFKVPRSAKRRSFNPDGLLLFLYYGGLRDGRFSIRNTEVKYRLREDVTPNWDTIPWESNLLDWTGWARWESESLQFSQLLKP